MKALAAYNQGTPNDDKSFAATLAYFTAIKAIRDRYADYSGYYGFVCVW